MLKSWLAPSVQTTSTPPTTSPAVADSHTPQPSLGQIDHRALDAIRALQRPGRPDVLDKVLYTYFTHTPKLLAALHEAVTQDDSAAIFQAAHSLKSSSANVGARQLAELSKDMEALGRTRATAHAATLLTAMEAEYAAVQQALRQALSATAP